MATKGRTEPARLRPVLGFAELTASGVGIIIGAGIYVLLGAATAEAGNGVWMSFGLAAVLCGLTGLSYAELASMYPRAGAEYEYTRHAFGEPAAFLVGWTMIIGLVVASAAIAIGFAHYLNYFVDTPIVIAALGLLAVDLAVATRGIRRSARVTLVLSAIQVGGLLVIIAIGLPHMSSDALATDVELGGVFRGAALVFFAFIGFDELITLAEETHEPTRVVPRALLAALGLSTLLYMAVAVAAVSVVGATALSTSERPLASVMAVLLGDRAEAAVAVIALVTTMNASLLAITAASRLTYGMARADALPSRLARLSRGTNTPVAALLLVTIAAGFFALKGELTFVASVTDFAVYMVFLAVNAAVIVLRRRAPNAARPFHSPGSIRGIPVLPLAGIIATLVMIPQLSAQSLALGLALLVAGAVAYRLFDKAPSLKVTKVPGAGLPSDVAATAHELHS